MKAATRRRARLAFVACVAAAVYLGSLDAPFTFDDWHVIEQNLSVRGPGDVPGFFVDPAHFSILEGNRDYRPVFLTSMALAWWVGDGSTRPFHIVSILLHALNALLLFWLVRCSLELPRSSPQPLADAERDRAGFAAALLFAVHPLATESVNYISSQSVLLATCLGLTSFALFVGTGGDGARRSMASKALRIAGTQLAYFLALLSKPIAIILPANLLLWQLLLNRGGPQREDEAPGVGRRLVRGVIPLVPFALTTLVYLYIRTRVFERAFGGGATVRPYGEHFLTQTHALVFYYLKAVALPFDLNIDREYPVFASALDGPVLAAFAILALLGLALLGLRRERALVFWALWFPLCLLVTSYLTVLGQLVNEHRVYLSLAGACAVAGIGLRSLRARLPLQVSDLSVGVRAGGTALTLLLVGTITVFALTTHARNRDWTSGLTLWEAAARNRGTYRAHMNYALALEDAGRGDEALPEFQLAVARGPYAYPHMNLGLAYIRRGESALGIEHLEQAVELWPDSPETHYFYAYGLEQVGDLPAAEVQLNEALALRPVYPGAQRARVRVQLARGRFEPTLGTYESLVAEAPQQSPPYLFELAFSLQREGRLAEAIPVYDALLTLAPDHRQGTFNLAHAYLQSEESDDLRRSATLFRTVLEIDSTYTEALFHLASLHWKLDESAQAAALDREYIERGGHAGLRDQAKQRLAEAAATP